MSEAANVTLTIGERIAGLDLLNSFKGSLDTLAVLLDDVKQFTIAPEEWEQAERKVEKNPDGTENWNWQEEKVNKEIKLQPATLAFLNEEIKRRSDAGQITLKDVNILKLKNKLA